MMSYGWILIIWMVFVVSLLTRYVFPLIFLLDDNSLVAVPMFSSVMSPFFFFWGENLEKVWRPLMHLGLKVNVQNFYLRFTVKRAKGIVGLSCP